MKTLITHINPHLDDIAAIWLFKKFYPSFTGAEVEFISASAGNVETLETEDTIYLGVGRGRFDEHKGDLEDCATSLVFKFLVENNLIPKDRIVQKSLQELVEWCRLIDLGRLQKQQYDDFSVQAFIRSSANSEEDSLKTTDLGMEILDRIMKVLNRKNRSLKDWEKRIQFNSSFGKSVAIESKFVDRAFCKNSGEAELYLMVDPKTKHVQYFTPSFKIDLEPIYKKVKELDPQASWFLHQSHHMVICGSSSAPDSKPTKLILKELIEVVKGV